MILRLNHESKSVWATNCSSHDVFSNKYWSSVQSKCRFFHLVKSFSLLWDSSQLMSEPLFFGRGVPATFKKVSQCQFFSHKVSVQCSTCWAHFLRAGGGGAEEEYKYRKSKCPPDMSNREWFLWLTNMCHVVFQIIRICLLTIVLTLVKERCCKEQREHHCAPDELSQEMRMIFSLFAMCACILCVNCKPGRRFLFLRLASIRAPSFQYILRRLFMVRCRLLFFSSTCASSCRPRSASSTCRTAP